jgi:hypothetical protein
MVDVAFVVGRESLADVTLPKSLFSCPLPFCDERDDSTVIRATSTTCEPHADFISLRQTKPFVRGTFFREPTASFANAKRRFECQQQR